MRVGIDARFLTHPQRGGFKTYTESLIGALAEVDAVNEYILYLDRPPDRQTKLPNRPNFTARIVPGLLPLVGMPWREQVGLSRQVARDRLDLLHSLSLTAPLLASCPLVVTIHDMIWFLPDRQTGREHQFGRRTLMDWYYRLVPRYAAQHAEVVLTVSQAAKDDIVKYLGLSEGKVFVTHEAASKLFRKVDDRTQVEAARLERRLPCKFILAIGAADPRKNLSTLVQAYALLPAALRDQYRLVIVWAHRHLTGELNKLTEQLRLIGDVQFRECPSSEDMALLYNAASLFVFPSFYEGFGLPPLEAMACGTPVIAANNSSIPEVVGDAALLVSAEDVKGMADKIARVLTDYALQTELASKGISRAAGFSWETCARHTISAYGHALSS